MNEFRQQLYSESFRPAKPGPGIFSRANLDPHYWPFKGIVWSFVVHASIFTGLVMAPVVAGHQQLTPLRDEAIIIEPDELKDVLYLPVLAESAARISEDKPAPKDSPTPAKEGLSYPGPQPVVSNFPKVTNHIQTVLQPTLVSPQILEPPLTLPNLVRLAPPPVEAKFKVPDAATSQVRPPTAPLPLATNLSAGLRPLPAPLAEARFKNPDAANPAARPALPAPVTPLEVSLAGTMNPLAAPSAQSRFKLPDPVAPIARPSMPVPLAPNDVSLSGTIHPLAAPAAQPRFKLPDPVAPIARPTLTVPAGPSVVQMSGPPGPLAAPLAESRFKIPDATAAPARQGNAAAPVAQMDLPNGPAKPLAAPLAESRFKAAESVATVARPSATSATTPTEVSLSGPARPLAAPLAESRFKTPDAVAAPARPGAVAVSSLEGPPLSPITPLGPPVPPKPIEAASKPNDPTQNLLTLSPTPARRDQQAVIPPGEARGQFAISPTPNLSFPGTEPGARGGAGTSASSTVAGVLLPPNANATNNRGAAAPAPNSSSFSGISILSPESLGTSRVAINVPPIGPGMEPLQTSYGLMLLAPGRSGGGLPDVGVFLNDVVHTVYLDMRKTIVENPISWTIEFGLPQKAATPTDERVTTVSSQQEVLLPFPITKERPVMPADLARKYPGKLVLAYAVINAEGKLEQLAIKQSPDPLLNETVLTSLRKWTFRPARRGGEIVPAKILLGIPVPTD